MVSTSTLTTGVMIFVFSNRELVGNKGEIIPEFSLEITQFDLPKRGGRDEEIGRAHV